MDYNSKIVMLKGADGASIKEIKKTSTDVLTDTYTITLSDGRNHIFNVANGNGIKNIAKTGTSGLVDTYTITFDNGKTSTFTVTNGEGIQTLQIGGRNLYRDTKYFNDSSVWTNYDYWQKTGETYNGFTVVSNKKMWAGLWQGISAKEGEAYTFSAYIKKADETQAFIYNGTNDTVCSPSSFTIPQSTDFVRYAFTFRITSGNAPHVRIECNENAANKIEICGLKLERGNIATDWTPAPEDCIGTSITNSDIDAILNS